VIANTGEGCHVPSALHLSPHPDDELIGAPATLLALQDAGFEVVNLACSLGRPADIERRRAELDDACRRVGFTLRVLDPPASISGGDDLQLAEAYLTETVKTLVAELQPAIVLAPSPQDGHHGHEVVGRAAVAALRGGTTPLWLWGGWADLPTPTIVTCFGEQRLQQILHGLEAHAGEVERSDYPRLVAGRAAANAVLAAERVFGFGAHGVDTDYAELVTEAVPCGTTYLLGAARQLTAETVFAPPRAICLDPWLQGTSVRDLLGLR
jgi:LmbE family N-acetylglucosaminyl deacetylase